MPTEVKGGIALRKALKKFTPDLAKETQKEMASLLKPITSKARGFIPGTAPLSGWGKEGNWGVRGYSASDIKRGIGYKTTPSKPNNKGFRSLAQINNKSAAGQIYEWAGRVHPNGREQAGFITGSNPRHANYGKKIISPNKNQGSSPNPEAGSIFVQAIDATGEMKNAWKRSTGQSGRSSRKMKGRAIFRAWAEDQGKTNAAVIKAIEASRDKFNKAVGYN
jgi:hypothetical protein